MAPKTKTRVRNRLDAFGYPDPRGERSTLVPGINQSELSRQLGICRTHVNRLLRGRNVPSVPTLRKLSGVLGMSLGEVDEWLQGIRARAQVGTCGRRVKKGRVG
mgnify:FL=1